MIRRLLAWEMGALVLLIGLVACLATPTDTPEPVPTPTPVPVWLAGATSMYPVAEALIAGFRVAYPDADCRLDESRSRDGLEEVRLGQADIGLVARDLDVAQLAQEGLQAVPVGLDGIVVVVQYDNPMYSLSMEQLRDLYAGHIYEWSAMGGMDHEVQLVVREQSTDTRQVFDAKVLRGEAVTLQAVVLPTDAAVAEYVASHSGAIGYLALNGLRQGTKGVMLEGIPPDDDSIRAGAYPLTRAMYLVIRQDAPQAVKELVGFVLSAEGQRIVSEHHVALR